MAVLPAMLGLGLVLMAAPRFGGEMMLWPARSQITAIQSGQSPGSADDLAAAAALIEEAGSWTADHRLIANGGLLLMRQAVVTTDPVARSTLLRRAVALTEEGLRRTPAQPVAWTRLAALRLALGEPEKAGKAMRLSLLSGPLMPQITAPRLAQGLALLPYLDKDTKELLARQVRLLQATQPAQLNALKADAGISAFIENTLANVARQR